MKPVEFGPGLTAIWFPETGAVVIRDKHGHESAPVGYTGIAKFSVDGRTWAATTDYYTGELPAVFEIVTIKEH